LKTVFYFVKEYGFMILQIQSFNYKHWLAIWRYKGKLWFSGCKVLEWNKWIKEDNN